MGGRAGRCTGGSPGLSWAAHLGGKHLSESVHLLGCLLDMGSVALAVRLVHLPINQLARLLALGYTITTVGYGPAAEREVSGH